ncbi:MAG: hypothetical protein WCA92_21515 [Terriglobales bacterium]|jgi:hypothetical protein
MKLSIESMAIEMPAVFGHPNRIAFRGVLTVVDVASDKAPAGARGHRVMLKRKAAEAAIPSLLGMALDYSPRLDAHDTRRKIGVITRAEIVGREIAVGGFLYGRDFPEIVAEIGKTALNGQSSVIRKNESKDRQIYGVLMERVSGKQVSNSTDMGRGATRAVLGMSYEIADAVVEDIKATVWVLSRVTFTGAAVLRRDKAAYGSTWIELG